MRKVNLLIISSSLLLVACGGGEKATTAPVVPPVVPPPVENSQNLIKLNQLGFVTGSAKIAVVPASTATSFRLVSVSEGSEVYSGQLATPSNWAPADESVSIADFSDFSVAGQYRLEVEGFSPSSPFEINDEVFAAVHDAALKAYYFNRASTELLPEHAGQFARAAGHPDTQVKIHSSAASESRPAGSIISAPKGWYDAGDYGKYVVNSGISTYSLLIAYEQYPQFYAQRELNIPESDDAVPDILDEIKWNLDWLQAMQDPADGGVYHKLTTLNFAGMVMPEEATAQRYVVQKGTAAALDFAAVMAVASRIYAEFDSQFPGLSQQYRDAAINAWNWAQQHSNVAYQQPDDVSTGGYGDQQFDDEFAWAAAELYLLTNETQYLDKFKQLDVTLSVPGWPNTSALGYFSLLANGKELLSEADYQSFSNKLTALADSIVVQYQQSAYQVAMQNNDFVWGSNSVALNKAMVLLQAQHLTEQQDYRNAALGLLDYVLGRNPTDYSYVTGFGTKTPMHIHHRPSEADGIVEPVPGFIAGGAQNGQQDDCVYPSDLPAKSYLDDVCSYSTNEIAINWNAPLVYVLAGLQTQ
ncbi:glycoside hydrolase family 9 protein [Neptunicella sp. SCSIO 80796]|uniref:glycoside hydrolase family 9 protein n=1 Tax=Neptunicella plasticusilytica TaxID=3117012 RepID=UPI003A4E13CD